MDNAEVIELKAEMISKIKLDTSYPFSFSAGGLEPPAELLFKENEIIKDIVNTPPFFDEPKLFAFSARLNIPERIVYDREIESEVMIGYAGGSSLSKRRALWKVLGESLERYSLLLDKGQFRFSSYNQLIKTSDALNPAKISFTKVKRNFSKNKTREINWSVGYNLKSQTESYIPTQLIAVPYWNDKDKIIWRAPITTGASAGNDLNNVIYNGICEVVERDAFMVSWLKKISLKKIEITKSYLKTNCSELLSKTLNYISKYNLTPSFYLIPTDNSIKTVMCILKDLTGVGPNFTLGLDADLSLEKVLIGSLEESLQLRPWCRQVKNKNLSEPTRIESLEDRVVLWQTEKAQEKIDEWLKLSTKIKADKISTYSKTLKEIIEEISLSGGTTYFFDTTKYLPKKIISKYFFKTGKICIPEFQPLYLIERLADFSYNRLESAEKRLKSKCNISHIEDFPHPML